MSLSDAFAQERRARLAAERMLEVKQAELFAANQKLSVHALTLSDQIVEKREEAEKLRGKNTQVLSDLEKANHAVTIAERRLWDSLETIEDGFAVFDSANVMIAANSAYLSVFDNMECVSPGITYPQLVRIMVEEGIVDLENEPEDCWSKSIMARWASETLETKTIKLWSGQFIKLIDRRSENGDTVSLALNITDTIRHEEQLKEARSKAEAANRAKSAFLANMSHELRTPMNGVVGMADLMADTELSEEQQLYVETIKSSGEALLVLINDVLDFSKIEAEKLALHPQPFDLERSILEVMKLLQPSVQDKEIDLLIDYDMFTPATIIGDPGRIRQILTNLIGNAVKFTERGHVLVRVVGLPENEGTDLRVHITVEDTGIGIPTEMIQHVFGEFNQVEDERNRKFEGTGLGLAITQQLVELMDGKIWVDSEQGVGSNFGFHITLTAPENGANELTGMPSWVNRVVLLDGQSAHNKILSKQLALYGVQIFESNLAECTPESLFDGDVLIIDQSELGVALLPELRLRGITAPALVMSNTASDLPQNGGNQATNVVKPASRSAILTALNKIEPTVQDVPKMPTIYDGSPPSPQANELRKMRILAAEDNKTNRLVFSKLVKNLNIELEFAVNGREAIEKWQSFEPDLIFMDISMPEIDGKEATRTIRSTEEGKGLGHTTIVALTAHAMEGDDREILSAGLDHYLTKPLRKDAIFDRIRQEKPRSSFAVFPDEEPGAPAESNVLTA